MVAHILGASASADDFSRRQILPLSAAVRLRPFTSADHERAALVREVLDDFAARPVVARRQPAEPNNELSIVMEGNEIRQTMRTGGHVVRQRYTSAFADDVPLTIVEPFEPAPTLASEAAAALDRLATQGIRARRRADPAPATTPLAFYIAAFVMAACMAAGLWAIARAIWP